MATSQPPDLKPHKAIKLSMEVWKMLAYESIRQNRTMQDIADEAIQQYFKSLSQTAAK